MSKLAFLFSALMLVACGGDDGSGVTGSKRLVSLSDGEIDSFCDYSADLGEREITCGDVQITFGTNSKAECVAGAKLSKELTPNCEATVADAERCSEDMDSLSDAELCASDGTPPSCAALFTPACLGLE